MQDLNSQRAAMMQHHFRREAMKARKVPTKTNINPNGTLRHDPIQDYSNSVLDSLVPRAKPRAGLDQASSTVFQYNATADTYHRVNEVYSLLKALRSPFSDDKLKEMMYDPKNIFLTVHDSGNIVGAACIVIDEFRPSAEILALGVSPLIRGQGCGTYLMNGIESLLREQDIEVVTAYTTKEAYPWFIKFGYDYKTRVATDEMEMKSQSPWSIQSWLTWCDQQLILGRRLRPPPVYIEKIIDPDLRLWSQTSPHRRVLAEYAEQLDVKYERMLMEGLADDDPIDSLADFKPTWVGLRGDRMETIPAHQYYSDLSEEKMPDLPHFSMYRKYLSRQRSRRAMIQYPLEFWIGGVARMFGLYVPSPWPAPPLSSPWY